MQLLLDTDIGTDVDDALALGVLIGSPEVDLVGITTVYGDTLLRARLASRLLRISRPGSTIPIVAGESNTRSRRPVWWPGHEGQLYDDLAMEPIGTATVGVEFLVETARRLRGQIDVLAIGPLTNIAAALDLDPEFAHNVRQLVVMGGDFREDGRVAEHNFRSDVSAAQRVFDSKIPIVVGGLDLTTQIKVTESDLDRIASSGAFGIALSNEITQWWEFHGHAWNNPHDPILALWLLAPGLFEPTRSRVRIDDEGISTGTPDDLGNVVILSGMRSDEVTAELVHRICAAGAIRPAIPANT